MRSTWGFNIWDFGLTIVIGIFTTDFRLTQSIHSFLLANMRFSASLLVAGAFYSAACAEDNSFQEPTATDRRSPCPMVNAVANHGFIARDGLNISMQDLITGFNNSVHLASAATQLVGAKALLASTTNTNFTTFNLDDLSRHGCTFLNSFYQFWTSI